jgi:hypothetical protein
MKRHRTDFVALFFGLAFLAAGSGFIVHQTTGRAFDASWIAAVALVSIGCIFLGATLLRGPRAAPLPASPAPTSSVPEPPAMHEADAATSTAADRADEADSAD